LQNRWKAEEERNRQIEIDHRYKFFLEKSNLPPRCLEKDYDIPTVPEIVKEELSEDYVKLMQYDKFHRYIDRLENNIRYGVSIFIPGNPGTRKTTYACEIGKRVLKLGRSVKYFTASMIPDEKINIWDIAYQIDLLIIDDLGMDRIEKKNNLIFNLVNKRIDIRKSTIIITNSTEQQNRDLFGDAFMDRLKLSYTIFMIGKSSREFKEESK
jgi:DNA replication protein DnaC